MVHGANKLYSQIENLTIIERKLNLDDSAFFFDR